MNSHPFDPTALIAGLVFATAGGAILAEQAWPQLDIAAATSAAVAIMGLLLVTALVTRQMRVRSEPPAGPSSSEGT